MTDFEPGGLKLKRKGGIKEGAMKKGRKKERKEGSNEEMKGSGPPGSKSEKRNPKP